MNVAYDTFCVKLRPNDESELRPELSNNHEEADTRMLLRAKQISESNIKNIVIDTPDTEVFLVGITASNQIIANLFIRTGTKNKARIISIPKVKEVLQMKYDLNDMQLVSNALHGLHAFTGCDTVSAFSGKGKVKPLLLMMKNEKYITTFAAIQVEHSTTCTRRDTPDDVLYMQ